MANRVNNTKKLLRNSPVKSEHLHFKRKKCCTGSISFCQSLCIQNQRGFSAFRTRNCSTCLANSGDSRFVQALQLIRHFINLLTNHLGLLWSVSVNHSSQCRARWRVKVIRICERLCIILFLLVIDRFTYADTEDASRNKSFLLLKCFRFVKKGSLTPKGTNQIWIFTIDYYFLLKPDKIRSWFVIWNDYRVSRIKQLMHDWTVLK